MSQKFFEDINILAQINTLSKTLNDTANNVSALTVKLTYLADQLTSDLHERVQIKERLATIEQFIYKPPSPLEKIYRWAHTTAALAPIVVMLMLAGDFVNMIQVVKEYHHVIPL